jgi:alpha-amylase
MVSACSNAGISIISDIITNHMSDLVMNIQSDGYGRGFAGSKYKKYEYPGLYTESNFHTCRTEVSNYNDINEFVSGSSDKTRADPFAFVV